VIAYEEIEAVAKAIFCADAVRGPREWMVIDQAERNYYLRLAKAATDAMNPSGVGK
jgi:sarcosine oxidase gamma subunit